MLILIYISMRWARLTDVNSRGFSVVKRFNDRFLARHTRRERRRRIKSKAVKVREIYPEERGSINIVILPLPLEFKVAKGGPSERNARRSRLRGNEIVSQGAQRLFQFDRLATKEPPQSGSFRVEHFLPAEYASQERDFLPTWNFRDAHGADNRFARFLRPTDRDSWWLGNARARCNNVLRI